MPVPDDVTVTRQVLAEPDAGLTERTWATLADGTPLVTAQRRGKGVIVLFHVTADTRWSDLPLSGTFVDMLKRIVSLAGSTRRRKPAVRSGRAARDVVAPTRVLDGFGAFGPPPATARPVPAGYVGRASADHPPGFYGPPEGLLAVNTLAPADRLAALDFAPLNARREAYRVGEPQDLRGPIFLAALALFVLDALVVFCWPAALRGWRAGGGRRPPACCWSLAVGAAPMLGAARIGAGRRLRAEVDARDPARLCDHRRRRGRRDQQGRPAGPHAFPRAAHRARSGRADRPRHGARRAGLLSADLLADRAKARKSRRRRRSRASTPT